MEFYLHREQEIVKQYDLSFAEVNSDVIRAF